MRRFLPRDKADNLIEKGDISQRQKRTASEAKEDS
jgi:hypothetical protein